MFFDILFTQNYSRLILKFELSISSFGLPFDLFILLLLNKMIGISFDSLDFVGRITSRERKIMHSKFSCKQRKMMKKKQRRKIKLHGYIQ